VTVTMEGRRPLLAELQALVAPTELPSPRRTVSGLDSGRVSMVLAVLERRCRVPVGRRDVYASTVGGARVTDPSADLAIAVAVASAATNATLGPRTIAIGEVGLAGELRRVPGTERRLAEAARLGFTDALVPTEAPAAGRRLVDARKIATSEKSGMRVHAVPTLAHALAAAGLGDR
jgi:DNA repair protein RadA/Sms